jgi:SAM-dependent methyltransferase
LPFPDETFDVAAATTLLEFTTDPARVISEMARVTVSGGRLVVGVLNPSSPWGIAHWRQFQHASWAGAHFIDRRGLRRLGARYGRASLRAALFAPGAFAGVDRVGPLLELADRVIPRWGAFQVLTVDLTSGARRTP